MELTILSDTRELIDEYRLWKGPWFEKDHTLVVNPHFCFIQIPKTASTTMVDACKRLDLVTTLKCFRHEGLLYLEQFIPLELPVYAIVRNPFAHIHSYFFHKIHFGELTLDADRSLIDQFQDFVRKIPTLPDELHLRQVDYLKTTRGKSVTVFKFENGLQPIRDHILEKHGVDLKFLHGMLNKQKDRTIPIKQFFSDPEIVDIVVSLRKAEFELFNYSTSIDSIDSTDCIE